MAPDLIDVLLTRLDSIDNKLDDMRDRQEANALKIKGIEAKLAAYASMAALFVTGIVQAVEHVFFS